MDDSVLYERRARICQVLADAKRLRLIDALRDDAERSVGELADVIGGNSRWPTLAQPPAAVERKRSERMTSSTQAPVRTYGFGTVVKLPYEQAIERTRAALEEQGVGVLTEIDVKATLKASWRRTSDRISSWAP